MARLRIADHHLSTVGGGRYRLVAGLHAGGDLPTVSVLEAVCRLLAYPAGPVRRPVLRTLRSARFLAPLREGDVLTLRLTAVACDDDAWAVLAHGIRPDGTVTAWIRAELVAGGAALGPYPAVLESFAQAAARRWLSGRAPDPGDNRVLMLAGARNIDFEGTVYPGDVLRHEVRLDSVIADTAFASGETWVGGRRVASVGRLIATLCPVRLCALPPAPDPLRG